MTWDCRCGRTGIPDDVRQHWTPYLQGGMQICDGNVLSGLRGVSSTLPNSTFTTGAGVGP